MDCHVRSNLLFSVLNVSAGSECGSSVCIWSQIPQVCTSTSTYCLNISLFYLCMFISNIFWWSNFHLQMHMMKNELSSESFSTLITHSQVKLDVDPPQLTFFLLIHNLAPVGGTNLSQVAIRDSISGIIPLKTEGRVVERGYQTFAIDLLSGMYGSQNVLKYFFTFV